MTETEIFLQNSCRICLTEEGSMLNIFDEVEDYNLKLSDMIEKTGEIKINFFDEYPNIICDACTSELLIAVKFKEKCLKTEQILISITNKLKIEHENEDGFVCEPGYIIDQNLNMENMVQHAEHQTEEDKEIIPKLDLISNFKMETGDASEDENINEIYEDVEYLEAEENVEYILIDTSENNEINHLVESSDQVLTNLIEQNENIETVKEANDLIEKDELEYKRKINRPTKINHHCSVCGAGFTHLVNLKRHMTSAHEITDYLKCPICFYIFNKVEFSLHMQEHEKIDVTTTIKKNKIITNDVDDNITQDPKRPHHCYYCSKAFVSNSALKSHIRIHTGEKPFSCTTCSKKFTTLGGLDLHQRRHIGLKPYKCDYCSQRFVESSNLKVHLRIHTGDKPHTCTYCKKSFSRVFLLQIHLRTHTGEKPYLCNICDKSFTQQGDLFYHKKIHTGERPHICKHCGKGFIKSSGLNQHIRKHLKAKNDDNTKAIIDEYVDTDLIEDQNKYISIVNFSDENNKFMEEEHELS